MGIFICKNHKGDMYTVISSEGMIDHNVVATINLTKIPNLRIGDINSIGEIGIEIVKQALRWAENHRGDKENIS